MKKHTPLLLFLLLSFFLNSCLFDSGPSSRRGRKKSSYSAAGLNGITDDGQSPVGSGDESGDDSSGLDEDAPPRVDVAGVVDPYTGTFKQKVSIPKNYRGELYLYLRNASALRGKLVKVRLYFGTELSYVEFDASLARTSGLTPSLDLELLALDMRRSPLLGLRLFYDLFDYNEYISTSSEPETDPYNVNMYCRGLRLEDDPTFKSSSSNTACDEEGEQCLYAYAKIRDTGLYDENNYTTRATSPLVDLGSYDFTTTLTSEELLLKKNRMNKRKCLPDDGKFYTKTTGTTLWPTYSSSVGSIASYGQNVLTTTNSAGSTVNYSFYGPYLPLNESKWEITSNAIFGKYGIFMDTMDSSTTVSRGIYALLFPRGTTLNLSNQDREYIGSTLPFKFSSGKILPADRELKTLSSGGDSLWMDGCNYRATHFDDVANVGDHSCNVTAFIEVIGIDPATKEKTIISRARDVKIQILREGTKDEEGEQVLYQSKRSCDSTQGCGENECCYNKRCWSRDIIPVCYEDSVVDSQKLNGETCSTDGECLSFCCDQTRGRCAGHNPNLEIPIYCSKAPGQKCVAKEWCRQDPIQECQLTKTGIDETGTQTCAFRCFYSSEFGSCLNGVCTAPKNAPVPAFNPSNVDCASAVDPNL